MSTICGSILCLLVFAILCDAYPASNSKPWVLYNSANTWGLTKVTGVKKGAQGEGWDNILQSMGLLLSTMIKHTLEISAETFSRFIEGYEKSKLDRNPDISASQREFNDVLKELRNPDGKGIEKLSDFFDDNQMENGPNAVALKETLQNYSVDKRPAVNGKYHYFKCYFNPVTCYRK